jgi:hypothetical protein
MNVPDRGNAHDGFFFHRGRKNLASWQLRRSPKLSSGIFPLLCDLFESSLAQAFVAVDRSEDSVVALRPQPKLRLLVS